MLNCYTLFTYLLYLTKETLTVNFDDDVALVISPVCFDLCSTAILAIIELRNVGYSESIALQVISTTFCNTHITTSHSLTFSIIIVIIIRKWKLFCSAPVTEHRTYVNYEVSACELKTHNS